MEQTGECRDKETVRVGFKCYESRTGSQTVAHRLQALWGSGQKNELIIDSQSFFVKQDLRTQARELYLKVSLFTSISIDPCILSS